jgi:hypothetical protein
MCDGIQNFHTGDFVEETALCIHEVAYLRYDLPSEMF